VILPDVSVLVYAFRTDAVEHELCRDWIMQIVSNGGRYAMSPLALNAVVRVTSNARVFKSPSALDETLRFCDFLLDQPNCQIVEPGERHWGIFKNLCMITKTTGPRVTDAWFAALAIEWGCEWITFDRDYARFPRLKWRIPTIE
jgi:uncharacterized protein